MKKVKKYNVMSDDCPVCGGAKKKGEECEVCHYSLRALGLWRDRLEGKR